MSQSFKMHATCLTAIRSNPLDMRCMFCIQEQLVFLQYNTSHQLFSYRRLPSTTCAAAATNPCSSLG